MNFHHSPIVIVSAARTAVGSFNGSLSALAAHQLGEVVVREVCARAKLATEEIDELIMGQVLTALAGQNPARQAALAAGMRTSSTALCVNQLCGSGLRAVALGAGEIASGAAQIVIAGGQESMSQAPHAVQLRNGVKMGSASLSDTMISDGLTDAFDNYHMGMTAENIARQFSITREDQDAYALRSQQRAAAARSQGRFAQEIVPVMVKTRKSELMVDQDEYIRADATLEQLQKLRPAFDKQGSVTAGNASGINDGAAAVLLMSEKQASQRGLEPLARIVSWATAGVEPRIMGTGPVPASRLAIERAGWHMDDVDLIEANEAFAVQALCVARELGLDEERVNVNGGAIALGHPIGASGARILNTLLFEMVRRDVKRGLATLCIGGGMGIAMCLER